MTGPVAPARRTAAKHGGKLRRCLCLGLVITGIVFFAAANYHLVYVSFRSQPGCHPSAVAQETVAGTYRPAKPAC